MIIHEYLAHLRGHSARERGFKPLFWALIPAFLVLLCLFPVLAKPIQFNPVTSTTGIQVINPKNTFFQVGSNFTVDVHAFNSTGWALTNTTASCQIHIYNNSGVHLIQSQMLMDELYDFEYEVNTARIYNNVGDYPFIVWCNSTGSGGHESGFISDVITVGDSGDYYKSQANLFPLGIIILLPLALSLIMIFGAISLDKEHNAVRIALYLLSFLPIITSLNIGVMALVKYYGGYSELQNLLGTFTFWSGIVFSVVVSYFVIYLIAYMFHVAAQKKKARLEY